MAKKNDGRGLPARDDEKPFDLGTDVTGAELNGRVAGVPDGAVQTGVSFPADEVSPGAIYKVLPPARPAPRIEFIDIRIPVLIDEYDSKLHGYASCRLDCDLAVDWIKEFRAMLLGARLGHATFAQRGRDAHVDIPNNLVRFICSKVRDAMAKLREGS